MEEEPAAGGGGVQVLVQRGDDECVAWAEEGVARLQLGAERVLAGFLVREDLSPPGGGECVELPRQLLPAGRDPG